MMKLGILASHRGTNFQAIIDACKDGRLKAVPVVAISNNSKSQALIRAKQAGIANFHLSSSKLPVYSELDAEILKTLVDHEVDLVITAGYMKKLGPLTLSKFAGRILNVHPSLLPKYGGKGMYGMKVHEAVIQNKDKHSGITIHWVDGNYDTGPIIAQRSIEVETDETAETLAMRVLSLEHQLLIETLSTLS